MTCAGDRRGERRALPGHALRASPRSRLVGFDAGREGDEPDVVDRSARSGSRRCPSCRRPARRGSAPAVPVPSLTTASIIARHGGAVEGFITTDCTRGAIVCTVRPSGSTIRCGQVRHHQPPVVGDGRGDLGHLQRRDLELVLADAHAPDVDAAGWSAGSAAVAEVLAAARHLLRRG